MKINSKKERKQKGQVINKCRQYIYDSPFFHHRSLMFEDVMFLTIL
jgi:hypothetical protein